ncbi:multicopper oxidase family protein [Streptosporangium carneum]|uniref:Multicopper oxidase CueO n=1 Tax=Streptosporangium carneum TaxID=47481 RepID=A0A9W6I6J0_9ACTN|nr:multicopper oxidase family protein [Streptosporangium carneum]GLK12321.1 multicopper oxidase [Streptosporangium carneum]
MLNRRRLLTLGGLTLGGALGGAVLLQTGRDTPAIANQSGLPGHGAHHGAGAAGTGVKAAPAAARAAAPFSVQMPVPPVLRPTRSFPGVDVYQLALRPANAEILPGVNTPVLTYGGQFVGPTIRARTGRRVKITYANQLDRPTNVHLHGGHVPASSDGHPMDLIQPGQSQLYEYPNRQQGATLWYHDHAHHLEAEHVYRGLHGFYLIDDDAEKSLCLPSGQYDVPIMLRNALFDANGNLVSDTDPAERTTIIANGKVQPYFQVAARKYRFRLLNSATEGIFRLSLGDGTPLTQIASDGGLLPAPVSRNDLRITSGERVDVVVDFSRYPVGTQVFLNHTTGPVLRFDVVRQAPDNSRVPAQLRALPALPAATVVREVSLGTDFSGGGPIPVGVVSGKPFDPERVDIQIKRGTTEIWNVTNADGEYNFTHNFHMHLVQFRVLGRNGGPPTADDAGRKDTLIIPPGESVRVQATFSDYVGRYVYHCHFLEHSAIGMMAQMEIVP